MLCPAYLLPQPLGGKGRSLTCLSIDAAVHGSGNCCIAGYTLANEMARFTDSSPQHYQAVYTLLFCFTCLCAVSNSSQHRPRAMYGILTPCIESFTVLSDDGKGLKESSPQRSLLL